MNRRRFLQALAATPAAAGLPALPVVVVSPAASLMRDLRNLGGITWADADYHNMVVPNEMVRDYLRKAGKGHFLKDAP